MLGRRRPSLDNDLVAAAQRRLAALAAQSHSASRSADEPLGASRSADEPLGAFGSAQHADAASPAGPEPAGGETAGAHLDAEVAAPRHAAAGRLWTQRFGVTAHQVTVASLLVVALVVAVAWWALRSAPEAHPVSLSSKRVLPVAPTPGPPSTAAYPAPSSSAGGDAVGGPGPSTSGGLLVIDVAGKVRRPGIVELPAGSRVVDAIAAAGGARPGVSLTSLNLARLLVDGEQIVVGVDVPVTGGGEADPGGQAGPGAVAISPVNLNTATAEQLDTLPDVGPVTAQAILQWRTDHGRFARVDDLLEVSGIGPATMADIRPYVYV